MRKLFEGQALHWVGLVLLLVPVTALAGHKSVRTGELAGLSSLTLLALALASAIIHQLYVWLCWRLELHWRSMTRTFPKRGFRIYQTVFMMLMLSRLVSIGLLAVANQGTLGAPLALRLPLAALLAAPALYCFYSVVRYFGLDRAAGRDHFDPAAQHWPMVNKGIFRYTANGMYIYGLMILWLPGLLLNSAAALLAAGFQHAYIWLHYYGTEVPDMQRIYAPPAER